MYVCIYIYVYLCMNVCTSQHYLNLFLPWHRCQAIHSCSRSHINTTIKIANVPATNKWKSLLLLLVQYTARTTTTGVTAQATQQNMYYRSHMSQFETWQWLQNFSSSAAQPNILLNRYQGLYPSWWSGKGMKLNTHLRLLLRWRMSGSTPPLPLFAFMACIWTLPFSAKWGTHSIMS